MGQRLVRLEIASPHARNCTKLSDFPLWCKPTEKSPDTKPPPNRPMPVKVYIRAGEALGPRFWGHSIHPHRLDHLPQRTGVLVCLSLHTAPPQRRRVASADPHDRSFCWRADRGQAAKKRAGCCPRWLNLPCFQYIRMCSDARFVRSTGCRIRELPQM